MRIMDRREFLTISAGAVARLAYARPASTNVKLRISPVTLDIGSGKSIRTVGYNGSVPGPILRLSEGKPLTVDVFNDTDVPEVVHWHGQAISPAMDGSIEEGTIPVPPHGHREYRFTPGPAGTRWYHTHSMAHADLSRAGFSGQFGFAIIDPARHPGDYDQEVCIAIHHWEPSLGTMGPADNGWEIMYNRPHSMGRCWARASPFE